LAGGRGRPDPGGKREETAGSSARRRVAGRSDTRAAGPEDLIAPQLGAGNAQQTFQRGNTRYHVFFDDQGKRHVRAFHVGANRHLT
jgi:hypothetical protein